LKGGLADPTWPGAKNGPTPDWGSTPKKGPDAVSGGRIPMAQGESGLPETAGPMDGWTTEAQKTEIKDPKFSLGQTSDPAESWSSTP